MLYNYIDDSYFVIRGFFIFIAWINLFHIILRMSDLILHQQFHADNIYYANRPKLKRTMNASWHSIFSNSIIDGIFIIYFIDIFIMLETLVIS